MQSPAEAIWRRIQEQRAAESGTDYKSGIVSLVNAASYLLTTFTKDGRPKPTPIWGVPDGDRLLLMTTRGKSSGSATHRG